MTDWLPRPFRKTARSKQLIAVFANDAYRPVLQNWMAAMQRIGIRNYMVVALDRKLFCYLEARGVRTLYRPCEPALGELWIHRLNVISELLERGHDVIHSDADAVWLKNPLPYLDALPHDMLFSQGTVWPPDVQEQWGFVLCCGFFMLRSNVRTRSFVRKLKARVRRDRDDQISCNRLLCETGTRWEEARQPYPLTFRGTGLICSPEVREGHCGDLTLALLPHRLFQRLFEEHEGVYVRHLLSEKSSEGVMQVLERHGCKFA